MSRETVDMTVFVPTLNGGRQFKQLARHLALQRARYGLDVLIIDSGSTDGTAEFAREMGFRVHVIEPSEFGHGRTRNQAARMSSRSLLALITHDVLPCSPDWPLLFARALKDETVAGVYGRQIPRSASTMEMFFVSMNYPEKPLRYDPSEDRHHPRPGRVLFSNAFSAVRRSTLLAHPFPADAPVSEDQMFAFQALEAGLSIVYEPRAEALHAHSYTLSALYTRSYLTGKALQGVGLDRGATFKESVAFLASELSYVMRQGHTHWLPRILGYEFVRWMGFQLGRRSRWRPSEGTLSTLA